MPTYWSESNVDIKQIREWYWWEVVEINEWHNIEELLKNFSILHQKDQKIQKPVIFIIHTIKWHGVPWEKENACWYHTLSSCPKGVVNELINLLHGKIEEKWFNYNNASTLFHQKAAFLSKHTDLLWNIDYTSQNNLLSIWKHEHPSSDLDWSIDIYLTKLIEQVNKGNKNGFYLATADRTTYQDAVSCWFNIFFS